MAILYNKLWKLLVDKKMSKADLRKAAGIAPNTMTRLRRDEEVTLATVSFEEGFSRDVTNIGHWGCGAVELYLQSGVDFEKAKPLIDRAFDEN